MPLVDGTTGRMLCTTATAARVFGCSGSHIRGLARAGILWCKTESSRVIFYDMEQVRTIAKHHREKRRKRGGRPPGKAKPGGVAK